MSLFNKLHGGSKGSGRELQAKDCFKSVNVNGYFEKESFADYLKSLRESEVNDLEIFFQYLKQELRMEGRMMVKFDRAGREYAFPKFILAKSSPGCKIIIEGDILRLIHDYQTGAIKIGFTAEELMEEALND